MLASRRPTTHPRGLNVFAAYAQTRRPNPPFAGSTMTRLTWLASHRTYLPLLRSPAAGRGVHESGGVIRPCGLTPLLPPNTVPTQDRSFLLPTSTRQGLLRRRYQLHVSRETAGRTPAIHLLRCDLLRPPSPCVSRETCFAKRSWRPQAVPL